MHGMMWIFLIVIVGIGAWMLGARSSEASAKNTGGGSEGEVEVVRPETPEEKRSAAIPAAFWIALGGLIGVLAAMFLFSPSAGPGAAGRCWAFDFLGPHVFSPGIFIIIAVIVFAVIVLLKKR